jgi:uncharacterized Zn finger protein (UPF0148 family)
MGQDPSAPGAAMTATRCPWCSAELSGAPSTNCPTCGATLVEPDTSGPGGNAVDAEAILRATRVNTPIRRSRLLSWITGEDDSEDEVPAPPGSLAPPPPDVRREMVRLELQAEYANLQAEAESIVSQAEAEARGARRRAEANAPQAEVEPSPEAAVDTESPTPD